MAKRRRTSIALGILAEITGGVAESLVGGVLANFTTIQIIESSCGRRVILSRSKKLVNRYFYLPISSTSMSFIYLNSD